MLPYIFILTSFLASASASAVKTSHNPLEQFSISSVALETYDKRIRPKFYENLPDNITVSVHVREMFGLDKERELFQLDLLLTQSWNDTRLAFGNNNDNNQTMQSYPHFVTLSSPGKLWLPDTYMRSARSWEEFPGTEAAKVYPNGTVIYTKKMVVTQPLPGLMKALDQIKKAIIHLEFLSFSHASDEMLYEWEWRNPVSFYREKWAQLSKFLKIDSKKSFIENQLVSARGEDDYEYEEPEDERPEARMSVAKAAIIFRMLHSYE